MPPVHIRRAVLALESYIPGKPIDELLREVPALSGRPIIKLASNENPLGPSPRALEAIRKALPHVHRYPESTSPLLRHALAARHGVTPEHILVGSGADEILRLVVETVLDPGDVCVVSRHAFSRFRQHAGLMGAKVIEVPMKRFRHDLEAMACAAKVHGAKIVFVANPNNPTSTFNTDAEVRSMFRILGRDGPWVVLDEAYYEFASDAYAQTYPQSLPGYFKIYPKLIVLRTLSKILGLAGVRVGYGVSSPDLIATMNRARLIFNVNSLGQMAALAGLADVRHVERTLRLVRQGRKQLSVELERLGFDVIGPGASNFIFARVPQGTGGELYSLLLQEGVIIRPTHDPGLERFVRITIGTTAENRALITALKKVL